jgi:MoaA/NifB/PqqE/SkfB family radical SAM enzyme
MILRPIKIQRAQNKFFRKIKFFCSVFCAHRQNSFKQKMSDTLIRSRRRKRRLTQTINMAELQDNVYNARQSQSAAKLKLWRYAGLMLTYRCNAACRFCYYCCGPTAGGLMPVETAIAAWMSLRRLAGEGAKVHLTGGEPFLVFERLLAICEAARAAGLGGADYVETNAGWVTDESEAQHRLKALNAAGLKQLKISWDAFHEEFVPVEKVRFLYRAACEIFGHERVSVRWAKHLEHPSGIRAMDEADRLAVLAAAMADDAGRFTGRAAETLAPLVAAKTVQYLAGLNCRQAILGAKGVHIDPYGNVFSGQCSGMAVGNVNTETFETIWIRFDPEKAAFWKTLYHQGPCGFAAGARVAGHVQRPFYASKCHFCTDIRRIFFDKGLHLPIICPDECYGK